MAGEITLSCETLQRVVLSTFQSACGNDRYQYLSGPVTGGRRYIDWQRHSGTAILDDVEWRDKRRLEVVKPNIDDVIAAAMLEREASRRTIEPGSFEVDFKEWGQPEFYTLWEKVISTHVDKIRFMNGWEFSVGCAFEYLCGLRSGCELLSIAGTPLRRPDAIDLLDAAIASLIESDPRIAKLNKDLQNQRAAIAAFA